MIVAIAIISLIASIMGPIIRSYEADNLRSSGMMHAVAVLAWWNINIAFAVVQLCIYGVWAIITIVANHNK
jgi:Tfp pilus assembly major pilin PilA